MFNGCSRRRVRDNRCPTYWNTECYSWDKGHVYHHDPNSYEGSCETMEDTVHPGWRRSSQLGVLVLGNMCLERQERSYSAGQIDFGPFGGQSFIGSAGDYQKVSGDLIASVERVAPLPYDSSADLPRMAEIALVKAMAKVNPSTVTSLEIFNDLDKTIRMLRRPLSGSRQLMKKIFKRSRKFSTRSARDLAKASSDAWLEYRYGWKPLILDCENVIDEVRNLSDSIGVKRKVVRASVGNGESVRTQSFDRIPLSPGSNWDASGAVTVTQRVAAHAGVIYETKFRGISDKACQIAGSRASDLPRSVWECIPYSFVVDWFFNVGSWLEAVTPKADTNVAGSWVTTVDSKRTVFAGSTIGATYNVPPMNRFVGTLGSSTVNWTRVTRVCNPSIPSSPTLTNVTLSRLHSVDAMALLAQQLLSDLRNHGRDVRS